MPQATLSDDQFQRLQRLRQNYSARGLIWTYTDVQSLREQVSLHLTTIIKGFLSQVRSNGNTNYVFGKLEAAIPDVRVSVSGGISVNSLGKPLHMMIVSVENHSPRTIYLSKVVLELDEGEVFFVKRDLLTDTLNSRRSLNSGERFDFHILASQFVNFQDRMFGCAVAVDEIRRRFISTDDGSVQRLVDSLVLDALLL